MSVDQEIYMKSYSSAYVFMSTFSPLTFYSLNIILCKLDDENQQDLNLGRYMKVVCCAFLYNGVSYILL